jgi:hypothetical protein
MAVQANAKIAAITSLKAPLDSSFAGASLATNRKKAKDNAKAAISASGSSLGMGRSGTVPYRRIVSPSPMTMGTRVEPQTARPTSKR